mmetsp:Transcript_42840/g.69470  ORF Transcript_42840/g.69470 Transcript_42840/m.69470 type:complete len:151 (-) Transcript_42840:43-495(-)
MTEARSNASIREDLRTCFEQTAECVRQTDFSRLKDTVYLDHAGTTLYPECLIQNVTADLLHNTYGNPHSQNPSSARTADAVLSIRRRLLQHFDAPSDVYDIVFTSGATAAIKLVGEYFPWSSSSECCYTLENHNSVLGIREYPLACGSQI